ncbi:MAG: hypothetical protein WC562_05100 [Dehalococcoidia bacterium]
MDWLKDYSGLYESTIQLVLKLGNLDKGITLTSPGRLKSSESKMTVGASERLKELQNSFADIEKSLKRLPKSSRADLREINRDLQSACRGYSAACKMFIMWGKRPTNFIEIATIETIEKADKDMGKVKENLEKIP